MNNNISNTVNLQLHRNKQILAKYLPENSIDIIAEWVYTYNFKLKITKNRNSKLGDYRNPYNNLNHQITINHNLNKYAFLITLIHEIAHLITWQNHKHSVKAHGKEWQQFYAQLLKQFMALKIFPDDINIALQKHINTPAASSCADENLYRVLKKHDIHTTTKNLILLETLPAGSTFKIHTGATFIKQEKLRKRFMCTNITTKRKYLFSPVAEVEVV